MKLPESQIRDSQLKPPRFSHCQNSSEVTSHRTHAMSTQRRVIKRSQGKDGNATSIVIKTHHTDNPENEFRNSSPALYCPKFERSSNRNILETVPNCFAWLSCTKVRRQDRESSISLIIFSFAYGFFVIGRENAIISSADSPGLKKFIELDFILKIWDLLFAQISQKKSTEQKQQQPLGFISAMAVCW